jgi:hypothetical protein
MWISVKLLHFSQYMGHTFSHQKRIPFYIMYSTYMYVIKHYNNSFLSFKMASDSSKNYLLIYLFFVCRCMKSWLASASSHICTMWEFLVQSQLQSFIRTYSKNTKLVLLTFQNNTQYLHMVISKYAKCKGIPIWNIGRIETSLMEECICFCFKILKLFLWINGK